MKLRYLFLLVFTAGILSGCYKDDKIVPTEGDEQMYSLPQGDHDYDADIVKWWKDYGFYTVYDYDLGDLYWANTGWDEKLEPNLGGRLVAKQADQKYIGPMLDLFRELFLDYYSDEWLKECMPLKIFLCSELWDVDWVDPENSLEFGEHTRLWIHSGYDHIAINGASEEIETMSEQMKTGFMQEINKAFLHKLQDKGKLTIPTTFANVSSYIWSSSMVALPSTSLTQDPFSQNLFKNGYLNAQTLRQEYSKALAQSNDFTYYIDLVMSYSVEQLESETAGWGRGQLGDHYFDYSGILHPQRGFTMVKRKYDAMVAYIQDELGINLDRIRFPVQE